MKLYKLFSSTYWNGIKSINIKKMKSRVCQDSLLLGHRITKQGIPLLLVFIDKARSTTLESHLEEYET